MCLSPDVLTLPLSCTMVRRYRPRMIDDPDIWRAASLLVQRHGHDAAHVAARRADGATQPWRCRGLCSSGA